MNLITKEVADLFAQINKSYTVIWFKNFAEYYENEIGELYKDLVNLKKDTFKDKERIVFYDPTAGDSYWYRFLNQQLVELDIPDFFVFFISNNENKSLISYNKTSDDFKLSYTENLPFVIPAVEIPDNVCVNPWINLELHSTGRLNVCCEYRSTNLPTIKEVDIKEFYSTHLSNIRQQFLANVSPPGCSNCTKLESAGHDSKRIRDFYFYRSKKYKINWLNPTIDDLCSLDLKLDNQCNLACRICNPYSSSLWGLEVNGSNIAGENHWLNTDKNEKFEHIASLNLEYLLLSGGEPLLSKDQINLLTKFVTNNKSKNINLHYNSNGTIFPSHLLTTWKKFKSVKISLSIDNINDKFNYERYGLVKWNVVEQNIKKFLEIKNDVILDVYCVVTVFNILDLESIFEYFEEKDIPISFQPLTKPEIYNILWLPEDITQHISDKISKSKNKKFVESCKGIIEFIAKNTLKDQFDNFVNTTKQIDIRRGQQFDKFYPELTLLLENYYGKTF